MMPIVDGLRDEFEGAAGVVMLNADEEENIPLQADYGVRGHPTFVVLDGENNVADRFFGPQEEGTLRAALAAVTSP